MSALLKTNLRRYFRHPVFWGAMLFSAVLGLIEGHSLLRGMADRMQADPDKYMLLFLLQTQAAVLAVVIVPQHGDGIFRLKVIHGNPKGRVYLAELLTGLIVSALLFFAYGVLLFITAFRVLTLIPPRNLPAGAGMLLLVCLTAAALIVLLCSRITKRIRALMICLAGMFLLFAANYLCDYSLYPSDRMVITKKLTDDPAAPSETVDSYRRVTEYIYMPASSGVHWNDGDILVGRDGNPVDTEGSPLKDTDRPVERVYLNIKYIGGPYRTVLTAASALNPLRPALTALTQFSCRKSMKNESYYETERARNYAMLPKFLPLQLGTFAVYCTGGWLLFRRKELN